ncbi:MAG: hypothetical protein AAB776_02430 [Patescibacteria group bacterium]
MKHAYPNLNLKTYLGLFFAVGVMACAFAAKPAQAAVITWDGGGADGTCGGVAGDGNKWSCDANWSGDVEPGVADVATFSATSTKNATVDGIISVLGVDINTGYTGIITQAASATLTVGTSDFDISDGTFTGGNSTIDINDAFTVSGGAFTSTTGNLQIAAGLTISSGTFEPSTGTVIADGSTGTWNVVTSETFNNLTINRTSALTITSGDTLVVTGTLTLTNGSVATGTIDARGNINQASTFDGGTGIIDFGDDLVVQTYTLSGGTAPTIRFDDPDDANDDVDLAVASTITSLTVTSGFSGAIPFNNPSNLTPTFTTWSQAAGTYDASAQTGWNISALTFSGGTFTPPPLVTSTGTSSGTWDVSTSHTFTNLTVNRSAAMTISSGDTLIVTGTLTLTNGTINTGTIDARTNISQASTFDGGTGIIDFGADGVVQSYTINGGIGPALRFDSAADANDSLIFAAAGALDTLSITAGFSGTIPITNASDFAMTTSDWTQAAGTFNGASFSQLTIDEDLTISGGTFNAPTTVLAAGNIISIFDVNSTQTFTNLTINGHASGSLSLGSAADTLVVTGALTMNSGALNTGIIKAQGTLVYATGMDGGSMIIDFDGAGAQTLTINGGQFPVIRFDAAADASDSLIVSAAATIDGLTTTSDFSGTVPLTNSGNNVITMTAVTLGGGTLNLSATTTVEMGDFVQTGSAVFTAPTTVNFSQATTPSYSVDVTQSFNDVTLNTTAFSIASGDTLLVLGDYTCTNGTSSGGTLEARGDVTLSSGCDISTTPLLFSGGAVQLFAESTASQSLDGAVTVNKSGGQVNLTTTLDLNSTTHVLTIQEGTFNLNGQNLIIDNTSGSMVVEDGGNFQLQGAETITITSSTLNSGSTVTYTGNGNAVSNTYTVTTFKPTYHHLVINSTDGATDTFQLGAALDVNGNFTLTAGTFDVEATNDYAMTVAGNWSKSGTFTAQQGTVTLDGTSQTLVGATSFYNLTKTVAAAATLTLPASTTQTVTNTLTLQGASGQLLSLRSSITDTQASINPQGTRTVSYLDVKDNNNINATAIICSTGCTDSLNNTNWTFPSTTISAMSGSTSEAGGQATFTIVLTAQPTANVSFNLSTGDATEGTVSPTTVTFTDSNWSTPQTITVTGVNDDLDDGDIVFSIITGTISSSDPAYSGQDPSDRTVTNTDNDTSGFTVSAISGNTTEAGGTATYTIVLTAQPTATVNVGVTSNDTTEGTVSPSSLAFTTADWASAHTVTVTGANDSLDDGSIVYTLVNAAATSADLGYAGLNPADVSATNTDDDVSGITVGSASGNTIEDGTAATFTLVLNAQPTADVSIGVSSEDVSEGTVSPASVTFTSLNWNTPQTITVTGVDDSLVDGNKNYTILIAAATSADILYDGINPNDFGLTNIDDEAAGTAGYSGSGYIPGIRYTGPQDGQVLGANTDTEITWDTGGFTGDYVNVYVSYDGGLTFASLYMYAVNDGVLEWEVPNIDSPETVVKVALTDLVVESAMDISTPFVIAVAEDEGIVDDDGATDEGGDNDTIDTVSPNTFIRGLSFPDVYYIDGSLFRHPVFNEAIYFSYRDTWDDIEIVSDVTLPTLLIDGVVLPKPGVVLVKIQSVPKVFAVFQGEDGSTELRWLSSEEVAAGTYGANWADYVIDIPPTFWDKFTFGKPIVEPFEVDLTIMKKRDDLHE